MTAVIVKNLDLAHIDVDACPFGFNFEAISVEETHFVVFIQYKRRFHLFKYIFVKMFETSSFLHIFFMRFL